MYGCMFWRCVCWSVCLHKPEEDVRSLRAGVTAFGSYPCSYNLNSSSRDYLAGTQPESSFQAAKSCNTAKDEQQIPKRKEASEMGNAGLHLFQLN